MISDLISDHWSAPLCNQVSVFICLEQNNLSLSPVPDRLTIIEIAGTVVLKSIIVSIDQQSAVSSPLIY